MSTDNAALGAVDATELDVAPGTEEEDLPLRDADETEVDVFARKPEHVDGVTIGASAWDDRGVGIGGTAITLPVSEAEQLLEELTSALEEAR